MFIVPLGVAWGGYLLTYYGFCMLKGPGIGIADLIIPSRVGKVDGVIKGWGHGQPSFSAPPFVNTPGVQPGSSFYPPNPNGGLPSKPPLGSTPPAYYN